MGGYNAEHGNFVLCGRAVWSSSSISQAAGLGDTYLSDCLQFEVLLFLSHRLIPGDFDITLFFFAVSSLPPPR